MTGRARDALRRTLLGIVLVAVALWFGVIVVAAVLAGTERGTRWLLDVALPEAVTLGQVEGRLAGVLAVDGLRYTSPAVDIEVGRVELRWRPWALVRRTIEVHELRAAAVTLTLYDDDADPAPAPEALPGFELPLEAVVHRLEVTGLRVLPAGADSPVDVEQVLASAAMTGADLVVHSLEVLAPTFEVQLEGALATRGDYPLHFAVDWRIRPADGPAWSGSGTLGGAVTDLTVEQRLSAPVAAEASASVRGLPGEPRWAARLRLPETRLVAVLPELEAYELGLDAEATGTADRARARIGFTGRVAELGGAFGELDVAYETGRLDVASLDVTAETTQAAIHLAGAGAVVLGEDRYATLDVTWSAASPGRPRLSGTLHAEGTEQRVAVSGRLSHPVAATVRGELLEPGSALRWSAVVDAPAFALAAVDPGLPAHLVAFRATGSGDLLRVEAAGTASAWLVDAVAPAVANGGAGAGVVAGGADAVAAFRAAADLEASRLDVPELVVGLAGGEVSARGRTAWAPAPSWAADLEAREIDAAALASLLHRLGIPGLETAVARAAGTISLDAATHGEAVSPARALHAGVEIRAFAWHHEDRTVTGEGVVALAGDTVQVDALRVVAGRNVLTAGGTVADRVDVTWTLDGPDLAEVAPGLEGGLRGAGTVRGALARPGLVAAMDGTGLAYDVYTADTLHLDVALDLADVEPFHLMLWLGGARASESPVTELVVEGAGRLPDHRLGARVWTADGDTLALALAGGLALPEREVGTAPEPRWAGTIDAFSVLAARAGAWDLRAPAPLHVAPSAAGIEGFCLDREALGACLDADWDRTAGLRALLEAPEIELGDFAAALPPGLEVDGVASVEAEVTVGPDGRTSGRLSAAAGPGAIRYAAADRLETRGYREARLLAELLDDGAVTADFSLVMDDGTGARAELLAPPAGTPEERMLDGSVHVLLHDRGLAGAMSTALGETDGVLRVDLRLGGTVAAPEVTGMLALEDGHAEVPVLGIRLFDVNLEARDADRGAWSLEGGARSGEGEVELTGEVRLPRPDRPWSVDAALHGAGFEVARNAMVRAAASPDLRLTAGPDRVEITGEVRVPAAEITPRDMAGAVAASPDVVVLSREAEDDVAARAAALPVHAEVRLVLGDSVFFDGYGLTGRITGTLTLIEEPDHLTAAHGELRMVDGEYSAFRQRLEIERGRFVFTGGPVQDPGLDLRVIRWTRDVLAGLNIGGTLSEPEVTIFSEPPMAESEALAYLLIGRPLRGAGEQEGELLERMAMSLGLAGGAVLAGRLGETLGLAEARIERGDDAEDAALMLGTYLSPRLYVAYGFGLFDRTATVLRVQYQLTDRWSVRTESGAETGADVLFRLER